MELLQDPWVVFFVRWLHIISGIMWIGLLWYFNFVQIPSMPKIPDEQKPAISKVIAPEALFWFRWSALSTVIWGLIQAWQLPYLDLRDGLSLGIAGGGAYAMSIGFGMWFGLIMAFNVWFIIWPNQKKALGIVEATPEAKAASARTAMLASRTNTMLSIPMTYAMVSVHLY
ncbi:MAG: urate hydroxylase PuuD [Alphaproteobacteria bacterium]